MNIYQLRFGLEGFDNLKPCEKLTFEFIQSFDGRSHLNTWKSLDVTRMHPELNLPLSDAPYFTFPVLSNKALKCLLPLISNDIEVLNLNFDGNEEFYGINVLTVLDAVDYEKSEYITFKNSNKILAFKKYCFFREVINGKKIFKITDERLRSAFVTDEFKKIVEKNGLTGFIFNFVCEI